MSSTRRVGRPCTPPNCTGHTRTRDTNSMRIISGETHELRRHTVLRDPPMPRTHPAPVPRVPSTARSREVGWAVRFLLFSGQRYYPAGGAQDYRGEHSTLASAVAAGLTRLGTRDVDDWINVLDTNSGETVYAAQVYAPHSYPADHRRCYELDEDCIREKYDD